MDIKIFLLTNIICCCFVAVTHVSGYCVHTFPADWSKRPKLYKDIDGHKTLIHIQGFSYRINETEVITAECEMRILSPNLGEVRRSVDLNCTDGNLYIDGKKMSHILQVSCDPVKWNLYESSKQFDWCPSSMTSYLLARPSKAVYEYLAGVCYNFERQQILSLYYAAAHYLSNYKYPIRLEPYSPSLEILNIPTKFITRHINTTHFNNPKIEEWMKFSQYEKHLLIQDPHLIYSNFYDKFGGLLEMDWWPNLRSGNWRFYEQALRQHIEADKEIYDILAGVSGAVAVPSQDKMSGGNFTMTDVTYGAEQKIPLYIWHYLKTQRDRARDLVVIGVNSAFGDFYQENHLIFCNDICHKIDWLKSIQSTFHYKPMGQIFCCDVEEVRLSFRRIPIGDRRNC